jgi:hypothetical protein
MLQMMNLFIPTNSITNPNIYTVTTHGCKDITSNTAAVHCYPSMWWKGEISAGRTAEKGESTLLNTMKTIN